MSKNKYYKYSPEKLTYVEVYKSRWHKYLRNYPLFVFGGVFCLIAYFVISIYFPSPTERKLLREKKELMNEFSKLDKKVGEFEQFMNQISVKDDSLYRLVLGVQPLPKTYKEAGIGGSQGAKMDEGLMENTYVDLISENVRKLESKGRVLDYSMSALIKMAEESNMKMLYIPAIMPIYNKDLRGTGSGFGLRFHPILKIKRMHEGMDFYARTGTEVYATAHGKVASCRFSKSFGNVIEIDHGNGLLTLYAHLSAFKIKKGDKVTRGQVIGLVGNTGLSKGPHLHYEVHYMGKEVNPINYYYGDLSPKQYQQIVELSESEMYSMD